MTQARRVAAAARGGRTVSVCHGGSVRGRSAGLFRPWPGVMRITVAEVVVAAKSREPVMSMSIGALVAHPNESSLRSQRRQDFDAMVKALKSGDLDAARKAMAALQKNAPAGAKNGGPLADVAKALKDGDLAGAQ